MRAPIARHAGTLGLLSTLVVLALAVPPVLADPACTSSFQCDDGNPCTTDTCDPEAGCVYANNVNACTDGNACTSADTCSGGACIGTPLSCDDQNACTTDSCEPATGCVFANNTAACDDGNACTAGDACTFGSCRPGTPVSCNDANPCTDDTCDPSAGCAHTNNVAPCSDSNACTANDTCSGGTCGGTPVVCDDANDCTNDSCNTAIGCVFAANAHPCDDGNACTVGDVCAFGSCHAGSPQNCDDGNACTTDSCDTVTGCVHAANALVCNDGNACTVGDFCSAGACQPGGPKVCGDNNVCTTDSCDPATGCVFSSNQDACNDGNACTTGDTCSGGTCAGSPRVCDDGNGCTTDSCDTSIGCLFSNNTNACDDGNPCTTGDACAFGSCRPGAAAACDDGNPCTDDSCDTATGACVHANNTAPCADGNACTTGDTCANGACGGSPTSCDDANPCTTDGCDAVAGCTHASNANACDDGNGCTVGDTCAFGSCRPGTAMNCNDSNPCTNDSCDPGSGACRNENNTAPCVDANACTTGDTCNGGVCGGTPVNCDDDNVCTTDSCDATTGCVHASNANSCDDGNDCTVGDFCAIGVCRPGDSAAQIQFRLSDEHVALAGGTLQVPLQAFPAGGNSLDVTVGFDPAVLSATGATLTTISQGASLTVDVAGPGAIRVVLTREAPFAGAGPVVMLRFDVLGPPGSWSALNVMSTSISGLAVTSCGDSGRAVILAAVPPEVSGLTVSGKEVTTISWSAGPGGITYDVTENFLSRLRSDRSAVNAACLSHGSPAGSAVDTHPTPAGDGFYYLVRAVSGGAKGSFGSGSTGESRTPVNPLACP